MPNFFILFLLPINYSQQVRMLIRHLEISECNIEKLYGDVFKPLAVKVVKNQISLLKLLHLKSILIVCILNITKYYVLPNQIMKIEDTPIRDISDGTFDGSFAESLEELHLINTWLTRVSPAIKVTNYYILPFENSIVN